MLKKTPPRWRIPNHIGASRTVSTEKLTALIRRGRLSGMELVRQEDGTRWEPLFSLPLFQSVVPHQGDPEMVARLRFRERGLRHGVTLVLVLMFVLGSFLVRDPGGLVIPAVFTIGIFLRWVWPMLRSLAGPLIQPSALMAGDDLPERLTALLLPLADNGMHVDSLQEAILGLHRQRRALERLLSTLDQGALEAERIQALLTCRQATTLPERTANERQLATIEARLSALHEARQTRDRLAMEEREMLGRLGELHDVRPQITQENLEVDLERVRMEMQAVEEVERLLQQVQLTR
ncbi:MAG: hypothetical protein ACI8RZ_003737 [Myxococcota bacterium]|jgi:hypothetical protein